MFICLLVVFIVVLCF